jgi:SAM-dependent methyltransferase
VRVLAASLLGRSDPLPALSPALDHRGLGIGDWPGYADRLARLFDYTNTHLDSEPRLDLTESPPAELHGSHDFVIAGDVLEHVAPPVETAMANLRALLRPGGVAILTVPFSGWRAHVEHFPHLYRWALEEGDDGHPVLVNERADGTVEAFRSLCFHGPGRSLEMRVFTETSFIAALRAAGFNGVRVVNEPSARHGVLLHDWPGPVVAYR